MYEITNCTKLNTGTMHSMSHSHNILKKRKKNKRYMYIQYKITLKETIICIFYFMSKCKKKKKNVFKALKMNIMTKVGKLKSTDQFASRMGQNLKTQFRNAL